MMISLFAALCTSLIPIPKRPPGIHYGPSSAPINIEVFVDITCPACAGDYNTIKQVLAAYPTQVNVVYHFFELPSHTWSYLLTRSLFACYKESEEYAKKMIDGLFGDYDQTQFYPTTLENTGEAKVEELAEQYAVTKTGIDRNTYKVNYDDADVVQMTRIEFKHSFVHKLKGTPTIYVNGVEAFFGGPSFQEWKELIDSLL